MSVDPVIRLGPASEMLGTTKVTLWRWAKAGKLPPPIKLSPQIVGWRRSTLDAWLANRELASVQAGEARQEGASDA